MLNGIKTDSLYQLNSVTQPIAVDNRYFFVENHIDKQSNNYISQIISIDNNHHKQVWASNGINTNPIIINDDLLYIHQFDSKKTLMKMPLDGGEAQSKSIDGNVEQLEAGDNTLILKIVKNKESPKYATTHFPKTRQIEKLINKEDGYGWLPNHATYELLKLDLNSGEVNSLLKRSYNFDLQSYDEDHQRILFLAPANPEIKTDVNAAKSVYLLDMTSDIISSLTKEVSEGIFSSAKFSPDYNKVAIIGNNDQYDNATINNFWLYNIEDSKLINVTKDLDADVGYSGGLSTDFAQQRSNVEIRWLNNEIYLFHAYYHGHSQLYIGKGSKISLIDDQLREIYDFNVINENKILLSSSKQTQPCELRILNLNDDKEVSIYNPNANFEQDYKYANVTSFSYTSSDHQAKIHGWVMHSLENQLKSPVIYYVHGGPHDAYGESFFHEFQVLAAQGYSILYVNPRGSTTYGQDFEASVRRHYGEIDYQDIMQGLDSALDQFRDLDSNRVFIIGGSYGGFMSTWAIGHTNKFKAAIAQRPITDWITHYSTSDIGIRFSRSALGTDLYHDDNAYQLYWNKSPLAYSQNVKTPIRLQHGEYDMRCPISQSEAYFTAVKQTGIDVDFIRYPQSYHGVSRHGLPNLRIQRMLDIIEWFNKYSDNK